MATALTKTWFLVSTSSPVAWLRVTVKTLEDVRCAKMFYFWQGSSSPPSVLNVRGKSKM